MTAEIERPRRRPVRIWLIVETILAIPGIVLGSFAALMSPMMFDAPGSTQNAQMLTLFWSVVSFPVLCVAGVLLAWIAFAKRRDRLALWFSLLPVVPIVTGCASLFL